MRFVTLVTKNLTRRKARTALTAIGIAVAIGATVALLGISDGFERSTVESFALRDVDIVVVAGGVLDQLSSDLPEAAARRAMTVPGVAKVGPGLVDLVEYHKQGTVISVLVQGWEPDSFLFDSLQIVAGRRLRPDDRRKALLGTTLAENIGKKPGDVIKIQREAFEVVGIYRSHSIYENGAITVSLADLQAVLHRQGSLTGFSVVLDHSPAAQVSVETVCQQLNALADDAGEPLGLSAMPTKEYASNSTHIRAAHAMAWLTSTVATVVGVIGVLNTMIMSVVERIAEISVLRALGWRKSRVVRMILEESVALSLVGATLGTLAAVVVTRWLATLPAVGGIIGGDIAPVVIAKGYLIALLLGLLGGLYPAYYATRLPPAQGIRHE